MPKNPGSPGRGTLQPTGRKQTQNLSSAPRARQTGTGISIKHSLPPAGSQTEGKPFLRYLSRLDSREGGLRFFRSPSPHFAPISGAPGSTREASKRHVKVVALSGPVSQSRLQASLRPTKCGCLSLIPPLPPPEAPKLADATKGQAAAAQEAKKQAPWVDNKKSMCPCVKSKHSNSPLVFSTNIKCKLRKSCCHQRFFKSFFSVTLA